MATTITMTEARAAWLRLLSWMSPAFPVGAFAYSHGLERAIHDGLLHDRQTLTDWISTLLTSGSGWNDAVLLAAAWRNAADGGNAGAIAELAEAMAGSRERHMETTLQGTAFAQAVRIWEGKAGEEGDLAPVAYPVAAGIAAARHGVPLADALTAYLHAFAANLVQVAQRLVPLGQRDGIRALAALEPVILQTGARASVATLDDLGSAAPMSDIMSMKHEIQYSRVFRS
jgi:urease accessory protein